MEDPTKSPFENPQLATGGSYVRMPDRSLLKVEGHDVSDEDQEIRIRFRDALLADADKKHGQSVTEALSAAGEAKAVDEAAKAATSSPSFEQLMRAAGLVPTSGASVSAPAKAPEEKPAADVTPAAGGSTSKSTVRNGGRTTEATGE